MTKINTYSVLRVKDSTGNLKTSYINEDINSTEELPLVIEANIQFDYGKRNLVNFIEGDLLFDMKNNRKNYGYLINAYVTDKGDLIIFGVDSDKYYIENGYLYYVT